MTDHDIQRFWSRVDRTAGCWIWTMPNGDRCRFGIGKRRYEAARIAYELHFGSVPAEAIIRHDCGNMLCVRPEHLSIDATYIARQIPIENAIPLTHGAFAQISPEDRAYLMQWKWLYNPKTIRAYRGEKHNGKNCSVYMHRVILNAPNDMEVDHINGDRLDNRRENLRLASTTENRRNTRKVYKPGVTTSIYKGVFWHKKLMKWASRIQVNRRRIWIGCFLDECAAAQAYDHAAKRYFGAFARLNFPD